MSAAQHGVFSVPRFHLRSPHVEWHHVEHPIRAVLLTGAALLTVAVAAVSARELPALLAAPAAPDTPTPSAVEQPELPREWRYEPKSLDLDFMYQKPRRPPLKLEDMYAKRRPSQ